MVMFSFFAFDLGKIWSKNSKLFVQSEIWYLDYFEYAEVNGDVHFCLFPIKNTFLGENLGYSECAEFSGDVHFFLNGNTMVMFTFFEWKYFFWENLLPKLKLLV